MEALVSLVCLATAAYIVTIVIFTIKISSRLTDIKGHLYNRLDFALNKIEYFINTSIADRDRALSLFASLSDNLKRINNNTAEIIKLLKEQPLPKQAGQDARIPTSHAITLEEAGSAPAEKSPGELDSGPPLAPTLAPGASPAVPGPPPFAPSAPTAPSSIPPPFPPPITRPSWPASAQAPPAWDLPKPPPQALLHGR